MQPYKVGQGIDVNDGILLRTYYEGLRGYLETERSIWDNRWGQLSRFVQPLASRFNMTANDGRRKDYQIMDNCATMAHRTLTAGLVNGICAPTRTWFDIEAWHPDDRKIMERKDVKMHMEVVSDIVRDSLLRSNWYQTAHTCFGEQSLFGTSAFMIQEDEECDMRCYPWPLGSYYLAGDATLRTDFFMRTVKKTVRQMVEEFTYKNCSVSTQQLYNSPSGSGKEQWFDVVQVIHKASYFGEAFAKLHPGQWMSCWYELGPFKTDGDKASRGLLRRGFFYECPVIAPRWDVTGEDIYGKSPAMDALGDIMGLQSTSMMVTKGIDKSVDPPMVGHPSLANKKTSILPGDTTYADTRDGSLGFRPAYQVKFDIDHGTRREAEIRKRIDEAFYKNMFLLHSDSDRRDITAEEVRAREEEKMTVLGPTLQRNNGEYLEPGLRRWMAGLNRRQRFPKPPDALKGAKVRFQFSSLVKQAQKMLGMANIERFMAGVGQEAAVNQGIFDIVDLDQVARTSADLLNIPAKLIRDEKEVSKIRADKAQAQQQAMQAENAQKMAAAAKNLSDARTDGPSALADLIHSNTGASP